MSSMVEQGTLTGWPPTTRSRPRGRAVHVSGGWPPGRARDRPGRARRTRSRGEDARRRGARAPPDRDGRADRRRAGDDEGRGDEARPGHVASSTSASCPRSTARSSRPSSPSCATRRRRSRFKDMSKVVEQRVRRASSTRSSTTFDEDADRRGVDRPGLPRALHDGRDVAVKVQYPGVAEAVRADMQNLGLILRLMKSDRARASTPRRSPRRSASASTRSSTTSSRRRTSARWRAIYRGHPFIVVPDVVTSLSRERVIVTEFVDGRGFEELKQLPAGGARPHRRDHLPLLLRVHVPPPAVLRRPAPGQLAAARRRAHGVPRLRPVQAHPPRRSPSTSCRASALGIERRGEELIGTCTAAGSSATREVHAGGRCCSSSTTSPGGTPATRRSS